MENEKPETSPKRGKAFYPMAVEKRHGFIGNITASLQSNRLVFTLAIEIAIKQPLESTLKSRDRITSINEP